MGEDPDASLSYCSLKPALTLIISQPKDVGYYVQISVKSSGFLQVLPSTLLKFLGGA